MLIENNELSYTGDDPIGLWPVSEQAKLDPTDCQRNIVVRNNTARWPRQYPGQQAGYNGSYARDEASCDCAEWTINGTKNKGVTSLVQCLGFGVYLLADPFVLNRRGRLLGALLLRYLCRRGRCGILGEPM